VFEVIPAIDLKGGRCVRLVQGDFDRATDFGGDPVATARRWEAAGARRIHMVDLDGAREGGPRQLQLLADVVKSVEVPVQLGGGMRTLADVEAAFEYGLDRVIIGTAILEHPEVLDAALERFGERVVAGVDARVGRVAARGWADTSDVDAYRLAQALERRGVRTIVYTDIASDGMLLGPNLEAMRRMVEAAPSVGVIASGGVTEIGDLLRLRDLGARGAIVGKALYTGAIDLREAITRMDRGPAC
jgi:phosphoribosylformimino-5-aminoimidazole carboxamide ribotide isomerase